MGDRDGWVTAVTAVTLPMHDTEVHVLSSAQATHRETLPLLEKQLLKKPPLLEKLLLTATAFLHLFWAADLASARFS